MSFPFQIFSKIIFDFKFFNWNKIFSTLNIETD